MIYMDWKNRSISTLTVNGQTVPMGTFDTTIDFIKASSRGYVDGQSYYGFDVTNYLQEGDNRFVMTLYPDLGSLPKALGQINYKIRSK